MLFVWSIASSLDVTVCAKETDTAKCTTSRPVVDSACARSTAGYASLSKKNAPRPFPRPPTTRPDRAILNKLSALSTLFVLNAVDPRVPLP